MTSSTSPTRAAFLSKFQAYVENRERRDQQLFDALGIRPRMEDDSRQAALAQSYLQLVWKFESKGNRARAVEVAQQGLAKVDSAHSAELGIFLRTHPPHASGKRKRY